MSVPNRAKLLAKLLLLLALLLPLLQLHPDTAVRAQSDSAPVRRIRTLEAGARPRGLAYDTGTGNFLIATSPVDTTQTVLQFLSPFADNLGQAQLPLASTGRLPLAFDGNGARLFLWEPGQAALLSLPAIEAGQAPATAVRYDAGAGGVQQLLGMAVDEAAGRLFILADAPARLLTFNLNELGDDALPAAKLPLAPLNIGAPRGVAFNPQSRHLFLLGSQALFELTAAGQVLAVHDLSQAELRAPQDPVFAPSADLTDASQALNLYLVDDGEIVELSLSPPTAPRAPEMIATLVHTIRAYQWDPPSPDSAGITYLPLPNHLLVSDSEVNEMKIYKGANLYEATLSGALRDTFTTLAFSNEPTGVVYDPRNGHLFVSDDNQKVVFEVAPGSDGRYGTADDVVSHFDTTVFGSNDPEGVTLDPDGPALYVVDGVNNEVYRLTPGADGSFNGVAPAGDDELTHFDTEGIGAWDPEGITFDRYSGHLFVASRRNTLLETTVTGALVRTIDVDVSEMVKPAGITFAPGSQNEASLHAYIVDRGVDNDSNSNENDGLIFEFAFPAVRPRVFIALVRRDSTLTWQHALQHSSYEVWWSNSPYFNAGATGASLLAKLGPPTSGNTLSYAHTSQASHDFYLVKALNEIGQATSNRVGRVGYPIVPGQ